MRSVHETPHNNVLAYGPGTLVEDMLYTERMPGPPLGEIFVE